MEIRNLVGGTATICGPDLTLVEVATAMSEEGIGSLGVIDQGQLVGIITERDIVMAAARSSDLAGEKVSDWMTPDPDSLTPDVGVSDAAEWLLATGYRHLPVVEDGVLVGIVSIKDVLWGVTTPEGGEA